MISLLWYAFCGVLAGIFSAAFVILIVGWAGIHLGAYWLIPLVPWVTLTTVSAVRERHMEY